MPTYTFTLPAAASGHTITITDEETGETVDSIPPGSSGAFSVVTPDGAEVVVTSTLGVGEYQATAANDETWGRTRFRAEGVLDLPGSLQQLSGGARFGIADWSADFDVDAQAAYWLHARAVGGAGTQAIIALGVDQDNGPRGILVSQKGLNAVGVQIDQAPGTSAALAISAYSGSAHTSRSVFNGSGGDYTRLRKERSRLDGVTVAGSTTFTSASGAFTVSDVGQTLKLIPSASQDAFGVSDQRTIAAYVNATTVTLDSPATASATDIRFTITGRAIAATQIVDRVFDDDGTTLIYGRYYGHQVSVVPFQSRDTASVALIARAITGQATDIFRVLHEDGAQRLWVDSIGFTTMAGAAQVDNSKLATSSRGALAVRNWTSHASGGKTLELRGNDAGDQIQYLSSGGTLQSRVNKDGRAIIMHTTAPADADLSAGQMALWLDQTAGAAKLMVKAKDSAGTVRTGQVALA